MGCMQASLLGDYTVDLTRSKTHERSWTPTDFDEDAVVPLELSEKLLVSDDASKVIEFTTTRNDIAPLNKHEILSHANLISRHAIEKLMLRLKQHSDEHEVEFIFDKVSFMKEIKAKGGMRGMAKALKVAS